MIDSQRDRNAVFKGSNAGCHVYPSYAGLSIAVVEADQYGIVSVRLMRLAADRSSRS